MGDLKFRSYCDLPGCRGAEQRKASARVWETRQGPPKVAWISRRPRITSATAAAVFLKERPRAGLGFGAEVTLVWGAGSERCSQLANQTLEESKVPSYPPSGEPEPPSGALEPPARED
jgi:hypothetical protein